MDGSGVWLFYVADFGLAGMEGGLLFGAADGVVEHGDLMFDDADGFGVGDGKLEGSKLLKLFVALGVEVFQLLVVAFKLPGGDGVGGAEMAGWLIWCGLGGDGLTHG